MFIIKLKALFIEMALLLLLFGLDNALYAQSDIIQIQRDCVISAEASNLFPKINEPVNIKVKLRAPIKLIENKSALYFFWGEGIEIISGNKRFNGNIEKGQIITMEVNVKFTERKAYYVMLDLKTMNVSRLVSFTFYVDGGFRESNEVNDIRKDIALQKDLLLKAKKTNNMALDDYTVSTFADTVKYNHTIIPVNEYERNNLKMLRQKNIELFNTLKKELDALRVEGNILRLHKKETKRNKSDADSLLNINHNTWIK